MRTNMIFLIGRYFWKIKFFLLVFVAGITISIYANDSKGLQPPHYLNSSEYVVIEGKAYPVPYPWQGKRVGNADDPKPDDLVRLPLDLTLDQSKIYVTAATKDAFVIMAEAAKEDSITLLADSGYRSPAYQKQIYKRRMKKGKDFYEVATGTAPPGYSEHMLGSTLDLVPSSFMFAKSPAQAWLQENAYKFNFIESYPENNADGFFWEPWHWKYVGP